MSRTALVVLGFLVGCVVGSVAVRLVPDPRLEDAALRFDRLEAELVDTRRDANDYERVALVERQRKEEIEEEVRRLRLTLQNRPAPEPGNHVAPATDVPPEEWDDPMFRRQLTRLSMAGAQMFRSPLIDRCAAAARAQGDSALSTLLQVVRTDGLDEGLVRAATMVLEKLGDPRAIEPLTRRWNAAADVTMQRTFLRALANIPGSAQVPILLEVWTDAGAHESLRLVAIHGLAIRSHPAAIALAVTSAPRGQEGLRARALASLHLLAKNEGYARADLIPTLGAALLTADGEAQRRIAILALEGFWDPACIEPLRSFAAGASDPAELRTRAAEIADAIAAGEPRPENAGVPRVGEEHEDTE